MEKILRTADIRGQDGANRITKQIQDQGKQTGERFNNDLYKSPKWRPYSPDLWKGGNFVVATKPKMPK
jgi:hypothetical protein